MFEMQAPYAPLSAIMAVINRHRQVRLQVIDIPTLERTGVSESLAPRTLRGLQQLGLVDDNGVPTEAFERLRVAASSAFEEELASIIRQAYAPVFEVVDPTSASVTEIEDAFRGFNPPGQRPRMVTLFTGLLAEAGLVADAPKKSPGRPASSASRVTKKSVQKVVTASRPAVETVAPPRQPEQTSGDHYSVELLSGGTVSVAVSVNLFTLSADDRDFVISLVDKLTGYGSNRGAGTD